MKTFNEFVNEGVIDILQPKDKEEIKKAYEYELPNNSYINLDKALRFAVKNRYLDLVRKLFEYATRNNKKIPVNEILKVSIKTQDIDLVKEILNYAPKDSFKQKENDLIVDAVKSDNYEILYMMRERFKKDWKNIEFKNNIDNKFFYFLSAQGKTELAKKFYTDDITDKTINSAFQFACTNGHLDTVKYLYDLGADISNLNYLALRQAFYHSRLDIIDFLLSKKPNLNKSIIIDLISIRTRVENMIDNVDILKRYGYSVNENIKSILKPKSEKEIKKIIKNMSNIELVIYTSDGRIPKKYMPKESEELRQELIDYIKKFAGKDIFESEIYINSEEDERGNYIDHIIGQILPNDVVVNIYSVNPNEVDNYTVDKIYKLPYSKLSTYTLKEMVEALYYQFDADILTV